jgi:hypothetical protein
VKPHALAAGETVDQDDRVAAARLFDREAEIADGKPSPDSLQDNFSRSIAKEWWHGRVMISPRIWPGQRFDI